MKYKTPQEIANSMDDKVLLEGAPRIGIFWIHNGEILSPEGCSEYVRNVPKVAGFRDSPAEHLSAWSRVRRTYPELRHREYDEVARGRITFNDANKTFTVMLPPEVVEDITVRGEILRYFNLPLPNTKFISDDHYRLNLEDGWLEDDNF